MTSRSLAVAKAHLSEFVDQAEHKGKRILILRHGKPAAAIVPVSVARPKRKKARPMTEAEADAFLDRSATLGSPDFPAVQDLIEGRR